MIREKDSDVTLRNTATCKYFKLIKYKGTLAPFTYCTLCRKILDKISSKGHGCVDAIEKLCRVHKEEPSRICILEEETVNDSLLYINPVRLDDRDTDYAFCARYRIVRYHFFLRSTMGFIHSVMIYCEEIFDMFGWPVG